MGTTLTGLTPATTYDALLKTTDNQPLTTSLKVITDGLGNNSAFSLSTLAASITGTLVVSSTLTASNFSGTFNGTFNGTFSGTSSNTNTGDETKATIKSKLGAATTSVDGYLTSTDWTTFNGKQNALTNPVTGTGTTNYIPKLTSASTIGNSQIFDNGTNVGIGTTTPTQNLQVGSSSGGVKRIRIPGTYNFDGAYLSNFDANGGAKLELVAHTDVSTSASWRIGNNNDNNAQALTFSYAGGQSFYGALNYSSPSMLITSTGNVGIGTSNPSYKLDVNGSSIFRAWSSMSAGFPFSWNSVDGQYVANGFASAINTETSDGAMAFFTAPSGTAGAQPPFSERMRITTGGNVGIGTQSPSNKLSVVGSGSFSTSLSVGSSLSVAGSGSFNGALSVATTSTLNGSVLIGATGDGEYRLRTDGGNVSILGELRVDSEGNILTYNSSGLNIGTEPILGATDITASGKLNIANIGASGTINVGSTTTATKRLELTADNTGATENNTLRFVNTDTSVSANEVIGKIEFFSNDASAPGGTVKAYISAHSLDTSPDAYLDFATDQVSGTPIVRQRIQSDGKVLIGSTTDNTSGNLVQVNGGLDYNITIRPNSFTAYTLQLIDKGKYFRFTANTPISVVIPTNATAPFPIGTQMWFVQTTTLGIPTFSGDTGVTLNTRSSVRQPFARWSEVKLTKVATDEWYLTGDLAL